MKRPLVAFIVIALIIVGGFLYWNNGIQAVDPKDNSNKIFVIEKGQTVREIGNSLKNESLIKDPVTFFVYIKLNGMDKNIQAGDYRLSPSMTLPELVDELNHGTLDIWVTIPEGKRADEIADILKENVPSYDESWRATLDENEGYLFPDTYLVPRDADINLIVSTMRNNFNTKIGELGISKDDPRLSKVVTIASLIEREAITDEEKPLIAGIINNRLDINMALQIDATVQYAKGTPEKWWPSVTTADYKISSPYNTYLAPGLPPGPISNPGIEALDAALHPQNNNYLYYIHDKNKVIHPARTIDEHDANVSKYL